jgi:hypothetical protein
MVEEGPGAASDEARVLLLMEGARNDRIAHAKKGNLEY